jgi:hypothetical protein
MKVERSRLALLAGLATVIAGGGRVLTAWADALPEATVYKSPT